MTGQFARQRSHQRCDLGHRRFVILARLRIRTVKQFQVGFLAPLDLDDATESAEAAITHTLAWSVEYRDEARVLTTETAGLTRSLGQRTGEALSYKRKGRRERHGVWSVVVSWNRMGLALAARGNGREGVQQGIQ